MGWCVFKCVVGWMIDDDGLGLCFWLAKTMKRIDRRWKWVGDGIRCNILVVMSELMGPVSLDVS